MRIHSKHRSAAPIALALVLCLAASLAGTESPVAATDLLAFSQLRRSFYSTDPGEDPAGAIRLGERVIAEEPAHPDNADVRLCLAWLYAVTGDVDNALRWIEAAIDLGQTDFGSYMLDKELASVSLDPRFVQLMASAKEKARAEGEARALTLQEGHWTPVALTSAYGSPIIDLSLMYDAAGLHGRATVASSHFHDGERSWRYGDGFLITFCAPTASDDVYSDRYHSWGISVEHGRPVSVLVEHDGVFSLAAAGTQPSISVDDPSHTATYEFLFRWPELYPFHPLVCERAGINLTYASKEGEGFRQTIQYVVDRDFDSERTSCRRFAPLFFAPSEASTFQMAGSLDTRWATSGTADLKLVVWAPTPRTEKLVVRVLDRQGGVLHATTRDVSLSAGRNEFHERLSLGDQTAETTVRVELGLELRWSDSLVRLETEAITDLRASVERLGDEARSVEATSSARALLYRLWELEAAVASFDDRDDPIALLEEYTSLLALTRAVSSSGTIYTSPGYLLSAFESSIDATLQPFSLYVPYGYAATKTYDLVVALHGSGVDEVGFIGEARQMVPYGQAILVAPRGRDLSDWYTGTTEWDTVDVVRLAKSLFHIRNVFCLGFSSGGYGAWRMAFFHPDVFDGAVIVSGLPFCGALDTPENDMRNHIGEGKEVRYCVFHGTADQALPIEMTDAFVAQLEAVGYEIEYRRIDGGGHADFDVSSDIQRWLRGFGS